MTGRLRRAPSAKLAAAFERFTKALLAVPAEEIAEQRAIYEREKRKRRQKAAPTSAAKGRKP
ncbi:MAG TPA: hypothetical protein VMW80_09010 [Candidatus Dormibacteraeota bacterium]|nr:hypothetical protein [Candidatus Dormibacteraeota bacterium]